MKQQCSQGAADSGSKPSQLQQHLLQVLWQTRRLRTTIRRQMAMADVLDLVPAESGEAARPAAAAAVAAVLTWLRGGRA